VLLEVKGYRLHII